LNNSSVESYNDWMQNLRAMSIPCWVIGHLQKLGKKWDKQKVELQK